VSALPQRRRPRSRRRSIGVAVIALATIVAALTFAAMRRPALTLGGGDVGHLPRGLKPSDLNLLFITLDTTRADKLGCYGETNVATPSLDSLASGVLFERAIAPAPLTLPAHSTIFTGVPPPIHGVRDNGGYTLDPKHVTLANVLKRGGWQTGAFVGAFVLDSKWGLDQGFDKYVDDFDLSKYKQISLGDVSRPGSEVADRAIEWLTPRARQRFFAWLHFYDPHAPYAPPEPYKTQYANRPYLGEVAFMDAQIGRVLQWLHDQGLDDRTIVVAMGDHGESLGEHGEGSHGFFVYDSTMHVPLMIRTPYDGLTKRRVTGVVRSQDVMPTVLALLGQSAPAESIGRSLVPMMTGATGDLNLDAYSESYYPRYHYGWSELRALRAGRFKLIAAPRPELYDLDQDPGETRNVYAERRQLADRMAAQLDRIAAASTETEPARVDPDTRERLAALGYVGSFTDLAPKPGQTLADPKDKIELFNDLVAAQEGRGGASAIERLQKVVTTDPAITDGWLMLGNEYFKLGDYQKAIAMYQKTLELKPDHDLATINLANAYRQTGQADAAIVGYERYLQFDPKNVYVRYYLGELYTDTGQLDRAEVNFAKALELDPAMASARNALAVVALKRGDPDRAMREIDSAIATKADVRLAHFNRALIYESKGDFARAREEYLAEIQRYPASYKAYFNLGKLYERSGDQTRQLEAYQAAIAQNPQFTEGYLFLAKLYLDMGTSLDEAARFARLGLQVGPGSEFAPLGHYVLADVYSRQGQPALAEAEAQRGRELEHATARKAKPAR
jgi:arylsulfatase A-like enzyme/Tfp pilus assembly protein PilF